MKTIELATYYIIDVFEGFRIFKAQGFRCNIKNIFQDTVETIMYFNEKGELCQNAANPDYSHAFTTKKTALQKAGAYRRKRIMEHKRTARKETQKANKLEKITIKATKKTKV